MEPAIGEILEGRVTGITKFGAFVVLECGRSGLVHISEVANTFVSDIHEHVQMGQTVKVKVLSISEDGKINLSIKKAGDSPRPQEKFPPQKAPVKHQGLPQVPVPVPVHESGDQDFEDRLKKFMQESDSRIADNRMYSDRRQRNRRR